MGVNYVTDNFMSLHSLEYQYVEYSEANASESVTETSYNYYEYDETELYFPNWHKNFWLLLQGSYLNWSLEWTFTLVMVYTLIFFIGIIGNCLVIFVVIKRPQMRTVTNQLIMNLAVADLLLIVFCVPPSLLDNIFEYWILGVVLCKGVTYLQAVSVCASAYSLAAISLDRCKAICYPQVPPKGISKRQAFFAICLIWTISLILPIPIAMVNAAYTTEIWPWLAACRDHWENDLNRKIYFLVLFFFSYFLPLIFIVISNILIWWNVSKREAPKESASSSHIERMHRETRQSVGKMLRTVTLVFLLSWLPVYAHMIYNIKIYHDFLRVKTYWGLGSFNNKIFVIVSQIISFSNSIVNPILYAFLSKKFREMFKSLLPNWLPCIRRKKTISNNFELNKKTDQVFHLQHYPNGVTSYILAVRGVLSVTECESVHVQKKG